MATITIVSMCVVGMAYGLMNIVGVKKIITDTALLLMIILALMSAVLLVDTILSVVIAAVLIAYMIYGYNSFKKSKYTNK